MKLREEVANYFERVGLCLTILINVILGGEQNQTFCARNYEWRRKGYLSLVPLFDVGALVIGYVFNRFRPKRRRLNYRNHCLESWVWWVTKLKHKE